ncbi:leucine-rich repeat domain-containing protein [Bacteroides cellulosilyticus]
MKLKHFYVSVCMVLVSILSINAQTSVTLTQAGTLSSKLPASEADRAKINELIINGPLNGADILTIRALAGTLKILNLKEANIVEDKVTSYRGTGSTANYTQNDVIGDYMFYGMTALTKVVLPKTVWSIGTWSKDNPWNEEKTQVSGDPKKSDASSDDDTQYPGCSSFARCVNLQEIELPSTLLWIGPKAFSYCIKLTSISIPEGVEAMGSYTFNKCIIQEINLPAALTSIGRYALNSSRINNLTIPAKVTSIGEEAFSNGTYDQVVIPSNVTSIGNSAFYSANIRNSLEITPSENIQMGNSAFRCEGSYYENGHSNYYHLSNVYWNSSTQFPKDKFGQIDNLYLPTDGTISSKDNIGYIFYNGITDSIAIAYSNNRYSVSKAMKTKKVTYARNFNQTSGYGEAAGWQTIVLPFNVKEITYSKRYSQEQETIALAPFGSKALETAGTLPFWLYELGTDGKYKAATEIKAHQAYLICMPNNDKYPSENNINGEVKFAASDAANGITLGTTQGVLKRSKGTKFDLVPTYDGVMQHDTVYVLNENNWYYGDEKNYPAGSVFIKNYNENYSSYPAVYPFRAYLATNEGKTSVASAPMLYSIGGGDGTITGIEDIPFATPEKATKAYSRDGVLYINTNADRTINIYDVTGRTVRIIEAREGMNEVHGLDSGIYLLEGQKVVIGR